MFRTALATLLLQMRMQPLQASLALVWLLLHGIRAISNVPGTGSKTTGLQAVLTDCRSSIFSWPAQLYCISVIMGSAWPGSKFELVHDAWRWLAGPSGSSVRQIMAQTGAEIKSWTDHAKSSSSRPSRIFVVEVWESQFCLSIHLLLVDAQHHSYAPCKRASPNVWAQI